MCCVFLSVSYLSVLGIFARIAGRHGGEVETMAIKGRTVGAAYVGQLFTSDKYFWGRPSCAGKGYDASASGAANKGGNNTEYLGEVKRRTARFLAHHPYLQTKNVPAEMVTASGSGLDPDITPECAYIQARRIAKARRCNEQSIKAVIERCIERPLLGAWGTAKVNVLKMNIALNEATKK